MSNEIINSDSTNIPSFEKFKKEILQYDSDSDLLNWAATQYDRIPSAIRILNNFDPTGISGAIDQIFSEKTSELKQENILRAIYILANRIWKLEFQNVMKLPQDIFSFLYFVYKNSDTDVFERIDLDFLLNYLNVTQTKIISMGQYLGKHNYIKFNSWVEGIWILHDGIVQVENELLNNNKLPKFVGEIEISVIKEKYRLRFTLLQYLCDMTEEDTFVQVNYVDLANISKIDQKIILNQLLPYLDSEGWIRFATAGNVRITEDGINFVTGLQKFN